MKACLVYYNGELDLVGMHGKDHDLDVKAQKMAEEVPDAILFEFDFDPPADATGAWMA